MGQPSITYGPSNTNFVFKRGPKDFIAEDSARRHDNISTSGLKEAVYEATDILISFSMPGLMVNDDFTDWKNFYAWAVQGGAFAFAPNGSVLVSSTLWYFDCTLEDTGFKPKRVGLQRYSLDCKFRVVPGYSSVAPLPTNSGMIMDAFWGLTPA